MGSHWLGFRRGDGDGSSVIEIGGGGSFGSGIWR